MQNDNVQRTVREGQKLINTHHFDRATIKYKVGKLDEMYSQFNEQLQTYENTINQTVKFLRSSLHVSIYRRIHWRIHCIY